MSFVRIDMQDLSAIFDDIPESYNKIGGRGLTSALINEEVSPQCNPLGKNNKLIFAPGLLSGTSLVNTSRVSVGAKSPLTGTIKESNAGGTFGASLGSMGISALIFKNAPEENKSFIVKIDENRDVHLIAADDYKEKRTYSLVNTLLDQHGEEYSVLCIGPAGEKLMSSASIQSSDTEGRPCRAAARGGLGAVMGSKGIKALMVHKKAKKASIWGDQEDFNTAAKSFADAVKNHPFSGDVLPNYGTASLVALINSAGAFPCYNATKGVFDQWEKISGEALVNNIQNRGGKVKHQGCSQCIIMCSNEYLDSQGKYLTASLEYETLWAMGGMIGIDDLDTIAQLDYFCDDFGLDTMNTGSSIAVAMDANYKPFGDKKAINELLEEISQYTDFGKILGNGPVDVGQYLSHYRIPAVKGQSIAAYDPRALQGNAVTYATSPMGADHTAGNTIGDNLDSIGGTLDPLKAEGQVEASRNAQIAMALLDTLGICIFAGMSLADQNVQEKLLKAINSKCASNLSLEEMWGIGVQVLRNEKEFNKKAGFQNKDDRLPHFFYNEPLPPHNSVVTVSDEDMDKTLQF